jgi:hypothetical protein
VERIRIVVASVPRMLEGILRRAINQSVDMTTVATLTGDEDPRLAVVRTQPHAVVLGETRDPQDVVVTALLRALPSTTVVALSANGRRAVVHQTDEPPVTLEDASPQDLLDTVRLRART